MHLSVTRDDPAGLLAKLVPPVRDAEDREALWRAMRHGAIDAIGTDNAGRTLATKNPGGGMLKANPGHAGLAIHVPLLLHEGHHWRGIPLVTLAEKACLRPAQVFGVYPRKGTIAVGGDADPTLVDLDRERRVDPRELHSFSDYSIFQGRTLKGWPVVTVKGGMVAARGNEILLAPGRCRALRRAPFPPPP